MPREIDGYARLVPTRSVALSGYANTKWTSTRATTNKAPLAGFGALVFPAPASTSGPCTANATEGERLRDAWTKLWDETALYKGLPKATKDDLWKAFDAFNQWFDDGFQRGLWCRTKEDLAAWKAALDRADGTLMQQVVALNLVRQEPGPSPTLPGPVVVLPDEQVTGRAGVWGVTLGIAALAGVAYLRRRRRQEGFTAVPRRKGKSSVRRFRERYAHG